MEFNPDGLYIITTANNQKFTKVWLRFQRMRSRHPCYSSLRVNYYSFMGSDLERKAQSGISLLELNIRDKKSVHSEWNTL